MIRDEDGALTGYIYIDLKNTDLRGFVTKANKLLHDKLTPPANYLFQWSGEYETPNYAQAAAANSLFRSSSL